MNVAPAVAAVAHKPTVLVVDDEPDHCKILSYILARDYQVATAGSVAAGKELVSKRPFDIALVDFRMPGAPGTHLLAYLRDAQPNCLRFLITAYAESDVLREAINVGQVYRFLQKPIDPEFLRMDIRRALEHRNAERDLLGASRFAALGRLAGSVVHDLRNSLQAIAMVPALIDLGDRESLNISVSMLNKAQSNMRNMVDELTTLAKGGSPRYTLGPGSLQETAREAIEQVGKTAAFEGRTVQQEVAADLPTIRLSPAHCLRMLVNLLSNAAHATGPEGQLGIRLSQNETSVVCEVWDQGGGIPIDVQARIFEPMFSTKGEGGVGLGLWSCKTVMQAHGGTLTFRSEAGKGTTFVAQFPKTT